MRVASEGVSVFGNLIVNNEYDDASGARIQCTGDLNVYDEFGYGNSIKFKTDYHEATSGSVALEAITGASSGLSAFSMRCSYDNTYGGLSLFTDGYDYSQYQGLFQIYASCSAGIQFDNRGGGYITFIGTNSNVGIGVMAPAEKLQVAGNGRFNGTLCTTSAGTNKWALNGQTTTTGLTLKTTQYLNVTINGTAYKIALVN
jgi:hypothetical protein